MSDYTIYDAAGNIIEVGTSATAEMWPVPDGGGRILQLLDPSTQMVDPVTKEAKPKPVDNTPAVVVPKVQAQLDAIFDYLDTLPKNDLPQSTKDVLEKVKLAKL